MSDLKNLLRNYCTPIFIGSFFYWYFTRFNGLDPRDVSWLLPFWHGNIDSATHYLGWEYFRSAPMLQWPLGRTSNLGPGSGASIAMTDSIPLMAFLFKPFTHWYEGTFQYFGIWTLICFVLQSIASWKLIGIWLKNQFARSLGCCFFVIAPAFLDRLTFHFGLAAHWVILFALYLCFQKCFSIKSWILLGVLATLTQPYLAIMVSAVLLVSLFGNQYFLKRLVMYVGAIGFSAYQSGLFVFGLSNAGTAGFGTFSSNGLSMVDPGYSDFDRVPWSTKVPDFWQNVGQLEGFAFLGIGVLLIAVFLYLIRLMSSRSIKRDWPVLIVLPAFVNFIFSPSDKSVLLMLMSVLISICFFQIVPYLKRDKVVAFKLAVISIAFTAFALSNVIFVGDYRPLRFGVPSFVLDLFAIVRASGRFIWIPMYLVMTVVVVSGMKFLPRRLGRLLFSVLLLVQVIDSSRASQFLSETYTRTGPENYLPSKTWEVFGGRYKSVEFIPAVHEPRLFDSNPDFLNTSGWLWRDIGILGRRYGWKLNSFYFARVPEAEFLRESLEINQRLKNGEYDSSVLYIFIGSDEWELAKKSARSPDLIGTLDGVPILAPGMMACSDCILEGFELKN